MWNCGNCGKQNEEEFTACWNCGCGADGYPAPEGFLKEATPGVATPKIEGNLQTFKVFKHPVYGFQAIKTGWSWPAFLFDWIWAFAKKLWLVGFWIFMAYLVLQAGTAYLMGDECRYGAADVSRYLEPSETCLPTQLIGAYIDAILLLCLKVYFGRTAHRYREQMLEGRGFQLLGQIEAHSADDAIARACVLAERRGKNAHEGWIATGAGQNRSVHGVPVAVFVAISLAVLGPATLLCYIKWFAEVDYWDSAFVAHKMSLRQLTYYAILGNGEAQFRLGLHLDRTSPEDGRRWIQKVADNGNIPAMRSRGYAYTYGAGVPQDIQQGILWYTKAADKGDADAQDELGHIYLGGYGAPVNHSEALRRFRQAADQSRARYSYAYGYTGLGILYAKGLGVPMDNAKAREYYRDAANRESCSGEAAFLLAKMYLAGNGGPKDTKEGLKWLQKAAFKSDHTSPGFKLWPGPAGLAKMALTDLGVMSCKQLENEYVHCPDEEIKRLSSAGDKELAEEAQMLDHPERYVAPVLRAILPALKKSGVPVLLPSELRLTDYQGKSYTVEVEQYRLEVSGGGYQIRLASPSCDGAISCFVGTIIATTEIRQVKADDIVPLAQGIAGNYFPNGGAGGRVPASIDFIYKGVIYSFSLFTSRETLIKIANSAILGGPRAPLAPRIPKHYAAVPSAATGTSGGLKLSFSQPSWVEIRDGSGQIIFSQLNPAGSQSDIRGQPPFALVIGNASNVTVQYKGKVVELTQRSQEDVARLTLE